MSSVHESSAMATADHGVSQLLPTQRWLDVASVGTRAELEDLDELADLVSPEANCLLSISEAAGSVCPSRKRMLRNRKIQPQAFAPPGLRHLYEDKQALLGTLERNPFALEFASNELRADYDVVTRSVSVEGLSLQYAAPCLRNDKEVVLQAIHTSGGSAMKFASAELREDKEFVMVAVSSSGHALQHVSPELADDEDVASVAVAQTRGAWQFTSVRLQHDALFKKGYTLSDLGWRVSLTASDAKLAGHGLHDLNRAGYPVVDVHGLGFSFSEMRAAGYSLREFRGEGLSSTDAKAMGYSLFEMVNAGYDISCVRDAGFGYSEILRALCEASPNAKLSSSLRALRDAGFTALDVKDVGLAGSELRLAGYTAADLKKAGHSPAALSDGFSREAMSKGGYILSELSNRPKVSYKRNQAVEKLNRDLAATRQCRTQGV